MTAKCEELPYFEDSAALFLPWADRAWSVFLDSGFPYTRSGRFDILAAEPVKTLVTRGAITEVREAGSIAISPRDPFDLIRGALGQRGSPHPGLPFSGGAIGYFGYDLARRFERLPERAAVAESTPDMVVGIYDWAVIVDHLERRAYLVSAGLDPRMAGRWSHLVKAFSQIPTLSWQQAGGFSVSGEVESNFDWASYAQAFDRIQHYIREGDCYQVNLAQCFSAYASGNPWSAYQMLRAFNPAPFSAYLNFPQVQVLSSSPERFLKVSAGAVETKPIKGTRPRAEEPNADSAYARELQCSSKDRAENLMIVDLLRNDIGKVCVPGSVQVPKLFEVESYATVHHLVSTIHGQLAAGRDALDLLRASFPGGSITGAPKLRAMEVIDELEPKRRGVYCGSIGYLGYDGNMDSNIAIRTLVYADNVLSFRTGGGIVADSDARQEYEECYHKAAALLNLMERLQARKSGGQSLGR